MCLRSYIFVQKQSKICKACTLNGYFCPLKFVFHIDHFFKRRRQQNLPNARIPRHQLASFIVSEPNDFVAIKASIPPPYAQAIHETVLIDTNDLILVKSSHSLSNCPFGSFGFDFILGSVRLSAHVPKHHNSQNDRTFFDRGLALRRFNRFRTLYTSVGRLLP